MATSGAEWAQGQDSVQSQQRRPRKDEPTIEGERANLPLAFAVLGRKSGTSPGRPQAAALHHAVLRLQRTAGNRAVADLLQLTVNQPDDRYEQEADAVADQVMRTPTAVPLAHASGVPGIQRLAADRNPSLEDIAVEEEKEGQGEVLERRVQALRPADRAGDRRSVSHTLLNQAPGGRPLDPDTQGLMETRFGADFSGVRVHADEQSVALSRSLDARAFTHGPDIYFGENEYRPADPEGLHVLAHELTHVVQQGAARSGLPVQQLVASNRSAGAQATVQRMSAPGRAVRHNVYPWGKPGPVGSNYEARTDGGSTMEVWMGYLVQPENLLYWCHGHSLDTYNRFGYSVYSGSPMATVIRNEWTSVPADKTRAGDIAVWTAQWDHSAKFTSPVVQNGHLDPAQSQLSTKNGQSSRTTMSLAAIAGIYGTTGIAVFRHV